MHKGRSAPASCPACGAPASSFIPYQMKIAENRLKFLHLDIHPICTHFAVGGTVLLAMVFMASLLAPNILGINISYGGVLDFLVLLQPFFIVVTVIAGICDGKVRYKNLKAKFLSLKLAMGITITACAALTMLFHVLSLQGTVQIYIFLEAIFIFLGTGEAILLGLVGSKLTCPIVVH
jgi:hypothetical protein